MGMSRDRVRFFLPERLMRAHDMPAVMEAAFSMCQSDFRARCREHRDGFWVVCRPSQFARFIIFRMRMLEASGGGSNTIKELRPDLVPGEADSPVVEVWRNPYNQGQFLG